MTPSPAAAGSRAPGLELADCPCEEAISEKGVGAIEVFVAEGETEDPLGQEVLNGMLDGPGVRWSVQHWARRRVRPRCRSTCLPTTGPLPMVQVEVPSHPPSLGYGMQPPRVPMQTPRPKVIGGVLGAWSGTAFRGPGMGLGSLERIAPEVDRESVTRRRDPPRPS